MNYNTIDEWLDLRNLSDKYSDILKENNYNTLDQIRVLDKIEILKFYQLFKLPGEKLKIRLLLELLTNNYNIIDEITDFEAVSLEDEDPGEDEKIEKNITTTTIDETEEEDIIDSDDDNPTTIEVSESDED